LPRDLYGFILIAMTRTTRLVPFRGHETWVQITEPDDARNGALPLLVRHGGPGMAHNYVRNIAELADETGRTVIHYDQTGCGNSTHLPDAPADFWTPDLFVDEFHTVRHALGIDEYHLLGQSWGGMLGPEIAVRQPSGLASLAICNSPASMELWMAGAAELRAQLPPDTQAALDRYEAGTVTDPEYPNTSQRPTSSTDAICAVSCPCHKTSSTPWRRWRRSRRCITP
jgi:L-proline amide hydrolase